jgi:hypothetical protein
MQPAYIDQLLCWLLVIGGVYALSVLGAPAKDKTIQSVQGKKFSWLKRWRFSRMHR